VLAQSFTAAQWIVLIGTCCTGIGTIVTAWAGIVRARGETRTEAEIECLNRLKNARLDEEAIRDELHALRKQYEG
jgi:hypothetical protein